MKSKLIIPIAVLALVVGGAALLKNNHDNKVKNDQIAVAHTMAMKHDEAMKHEEAMKKEAAAVTTPAAGDAMKHETAGNYITYADYTAKKDSYKNDKVVYFFAAGWCPTCQAVTKDIQANLGKIPAGTDIVRIDYDNSTDLKKQYGVTYQHTFVQVDNSGKQLKKWSASPTLSAIVAETI